MDPNQINGYCSRCGLPLKYVFYLYGKPLGSDCFEKVAGLKIEWLSAYLDANGIFDHVAYQRDKDEREAKRLAEAIAYEERRAATEQENRWLIDELTPHSQIDVNGYAINFAGSILLSLKNHQLACDLPRKAKAIVADILCKGYRGKARAQRSNEVWDRLELPEAVS